MSMWTYITKMPKKTIQSDWAEYQRLRGRVASAQHEYDIKRSRLSANNGCIYMRMYDVPDFGRDNDGGVGISREFCEFFHYDEPCNKLQCAHYQNNVDYFKAAHDLHILKKQRKIFWTQKFANCR